MRQRRPERLLEEGVRGMLPKTKLGDAMFRKLKVYAGQRSSARRAATPRLRGRLTLAATQYYATGRRKESTARVFLRPGTGTITVNHREFVNYFPAEALRIQVVQPLSLTESGRQVRRALHGGRRRHHRTGRRDSSRHRARAVRVQLRAIARGSRRKGCSRAMRARRSARSTAWLAPASGSSSVNGSDVGAHVPTMEDI